MLPSKCEACEKDFNQEFRKPRKLDCGCILCERCLKSFYKIQQMFNCKKHNIITYRPIEKLEMEVSHLQEESKQNLLNICQEHNEILAFYCLSDSILICEKCQWNSHKKHQCGRQEEIVPIMQVRMQMTLSAMKERLNQYSSVLGQ